LHLCPSCLVGLPVVWLFFMKQKSTLALCSTDQLFHEQ
jgi:hypothetical protein